MAENGESWHDIDIEENSKENNQEVQKFLEYHAEKKIDIDTINETLNKWKKIKITFAVIGRTNSGKSSLINAIRNVKDVNEEKAAVSVTECTRRPKSYALPGNPNIIFWDLPGVGTKNYEKTKYLNFIEFEKYDFFLIITCSRITELDEWLAEELFKRKKTIYFVRTKIDQDVENDKCDKKDAHNPKTVLKSIRMEYMKHLSDKKIKCPIFLVSNIHPNEYEMNKLIDEIVKDCDASKKDAFVLSISKVDSKSVLEAKTEELKKRIWKIAILSAAGTAIPIPGIGVAFDIVIIAEEVECYRQQFGLTEKHINEAAKSLGITNEELGEKFDLKSMAIVISVRGLAAMSSSLLFTNLLQSASKVAVPVIGGLILAPVSYGAIALLLRRILKVMYEDAVKLNGVVCDKALAGPADISIDISHQVSIAVIGLSGSGKSSFINAFRGLSSDSEGAAKVDVVETTTKTKEYEYGNIKLVDTPGLGTAEFTKTEYLKRVPLKEYSFVIYCLRSEIESDDEWLLTRVKKCKIVLVRTNLKENGTGENVKTDGIINHLKKSCKEKLKALKLTNVKVFVIDNKEPKRYEFKDLQEHIRNECYSITHTDKKSCKLM